MANVLQAAASVGQQEKEDENAKGGNFINSGKQDPGGGVEADSGPAGAPAEEGKEEAPKGGDPDAGQGGRSEEHTSELQSPS